MQCEHIILNHFAADMGWRRGVAAGLGCSNDFAHEVLEAVAPMSRWITPLGVLNGVEQAVKLEGNSTQPKSLSGGSFAKRMVMLEERRVASLQFRMLSRRKK